MADVDVTRVAKDYPEIINWIISVGVFLFVSINGLLFFFIRKIFADKEHQINSLFKDLKIEINDIRSLLNETTRSTDAMNKDTYSRIDKIITDFERKAQILNEELHKLDINVRLAQEKMSAVAEIQKDLRALSDRALRLETTMISMEKVVENFGKIILKP